MFKVVLFIAFSTATLLVVSYIGIGSSKGCGPFREFHVIFIHYDIKINCGKIIKFESYLACHYITICIFQCNFNITELEVEGKVWADDCSAYDYIDYLIHSEGAMNETVRKVNLNYHLSRGR